MLVVSAPDERGLEQLLGAVDAHLFAAGRNRVVPLPLDGASCRSFRSSAAGR